MAIELIRIVGSNWLPHGLAEEDVGDLALLFMRFEFAVMAAGFVLNGAPAKPDWDAVVVEIDKEGRLDAIDEVLSRAMSTLRAHPPMQLTFDRAKKALSWVARPIPKNSVAWNGLRWAIYDAYAVRNNLLHGSKLLAYNADRPRDVVVMHCARVIVSACIQSSSEISKHFFAEYL